MKTICIENNISSAIGGGVRFGNENEVLTTYNGDRSSKLREKNIERFGKQIIKLSRQQILDILNEENNIQIVSNYGVNNIPGLYQNIENHNILTKTGCCEILGNYKSIKKYLPRFCIIDGNKINKDNIIQITKLSILKRFTIGEKIIIKHSLLDGNGNGIYIINIDKDVEKNIEKALNKFNLKLNDFNKLFGVDYIIQEYIENKILEGSITFNIQNWGFDNWGLVNNCVIDGEYFASLNYFPNIDNNKIKELEKKIFADFIDLLKDLKNQGIRGNIGFDLIIFSGKNDIHINILECNGLYRTTGSTLVNNFAYNTKNLLFLGIPLHIRYLIEKYQKISEQKLLKIEQVLRKQGTNKGEEQIINFKCDGLEYDYPVIWIGTSGSNFDNLVRLIYEVGILNSLGKSYIKNILNNITHFNL